MSGLRALVVNLFRLAFGERCVLCNEALLFNSDTGYPLCKACRASLGGGLSASGRERCRSCGRPLISEIDVCTTCRTQSFYFDCHRSLFYYEGACSELLRSYKFSGDRSLAALFAELLQAEIGRVTENTCVVPVPPSRAGLRRRGFDQALALARRLSAVYDIPYRRLLSRRGSTEQKKLDRQGRAANMHASIVASRSGQARRERAKEGSSRYLLLDDVYTTGATLSACAAVLKRDFSASYVSALTVAMD